MKIVFKAQVSRRVITSSIIYNCTKAALEMLTKSLAVQLGPHKITVNSVCPGVVDTDMLTEVQTDYDEDFSKEMDKLYKNLESRTPTQKFIMPMSDVVNAILYLGSGMTSQITGSSIFVDGGYVAS